MRFNSRLAWLAGVAFLLPTALTAQQQYQGALSDHLEITAYVSGLVHWKEATPAERSSIPETLASGDHVLVGSLSFARGAVSYPGAFVKKADGTSELYVDDHHTGHFTAADKHLFLAPLAGEDTTMAATTELTLPLEQGPFPTFPAVVSLLRPDASPDWSPPPGWKRPDFLLTGSPYIGGTASVAGRTLIVRFAYDLATGTVDLKNAAEWMDINAPGKIDYLADRQIPQGKPPIFHVGSLYLAATAVDLKARTFTLISVPAGQYTRFDLAKGATLPDFTWTGFNGGQHKFSELGGQYRLIDFWATWCVPCVADLPSKKAIYAKYHRRGLEILGVDAAERTPGAAPKLIVEKGISWPQAQFDHDLVETHFGVYVFPTLILVDQSGRIVSTADSELMGDALDKTLAKLLPVSK